MPTVLLVEDNEANRDMLARRLRRYDWTVLQAADGRQGIEMASACLPDIVLMDMSLPEIDGWEATRMLKHLDRTMHIPIIALTAHAMNEHMDRAMQAGCDEFETKPVDFKRLMSKMTSLAGITKSSKSECMFKQLEGAVCL